MRLEVVRDSSACEPMFSMKTIRDNDDAGYAPNYAQS
jgi:hypothetical protein